MKRKLTAFGDLPLLSSIDSGQPDSSEGRSEYVELFETSDKDEPQIFDTNLFRAIGFSAFDEFEVILTGSDDSVGGKTSAWHDVLLKIVQHAGISHEELATVSFRLEKVFPHGRMQHVVLWSIEDSELSCKEQELVFLYHLAKSFRSFIQDHPKAYSHIAALRAELSKLWWQALVTVELRQHGFNSKQRVIATEFSRSEEWAAKATPAKKKKFIENLRDKNMPRPMARAKYMSEFDVSRSQASRMFSKYGWPGSKGKRS